MTDVMRLVVVGAGVAGVSAAGAARTAGWEGEITLLGDEPGLPYRRPPVSKEVVRGEKTADEIRIKPEAWYEKQGIELRHGVGVVSLDVDAHALTLDDGSSLPYDRLVLATGGSPRLLPDVPAGVVTLRRFGDAEALRERLVDGAHVVVVGAGLIGSEIAASAREAGAEVTLLETASLPLPRLLPADLGAMYAHLHASEGTDLQTDVTVAAITESSDGLVVEAADGRSWTAPVVVLAVGMAPRTELAEAAGITLDPALGGIAVDELGRTSAPDVYAAGDVAAMPNGVLGGRHRVEHWQGAQNHGAAVGRSVAGDEKAFVEVPWAWSDQYGHNLQVAGWPSAAHTTVVRGSLDDRDFTAFYLEGDVVRGAVTIGRPREIRTARAWVAEHARLDAARLADESVPLEESVLP